jgi:PKD domain
MRRLRVAVLLAAVGAALAGTPAASATGWVATGPLSPADRIAVGPEVAIAPDGERIAAWIEVGDGPSAPGGISVRVAPPHGPFGPTQTFTGSDGQLQLAVGNDGTIALAWINSELGKIQVARREPGQSSFVEAGSLGVPVETPSDLRIAVSGGDVFMAFETGAGFSTSIWAARLAAASTDPVIVPGPGSLGRIDQATSPVTGPADFEFTPGVAAQSGQIFVSWEREKSAAAGGHGTTTVNLSKRMPGGPDGQMGAPMPLDTVSSTNENAVSTFPRIAAGGGHTYVVWNRVVSNPQVAYEDVSNSGPIHTIPTDPDFEDIAAGVDGSGNLFVGGDGIPPGVTTSNGAVAATIVAPGATPTPAVRITPVGIGRQLDGLAVASDGTALLLPDRFSAEFDHTVQTLASFRPPGHAFGPPEDVSGIQDADEVESPMAAPAVAPGGRALIAWAASQGSGVANQRVWVSERDATAPVFGAISVPPSAAVGQAVALSAGATDQLSGSTIHWDFGDGSQAAGARVSHVYGTPGRMSVTITATDGAGNSSTQTRTISVKPATGTGDHVPPRIVALRLSHSRFRVGARGTATLAARRRVPVGTLVHLTLSERATVAIVIRHRGTVRGTLVRGSVGPGPSTVAFSGRIGRKALAAGGYTAIVTAIDRAGNRSRNSKINFTIVAG